MNATASANIEKWLAGNYDDATKSEIRKLQESGSPDLEDAFYRQLEFGTGGLRGLMGVGTNRMNKYTVGLATQGFANYLRKEFGGQEIKVVIGHDCRNNSRFFAETVANVFAANGVKVLLFDALRPTPEISFAIRHLGCQAGVICTASHNPKEYNGYKAYWNDGGQLVPPHDKNVIKEVEAIASVDDVKFTGGEANITLIGEEVDKAYLQMLKGLSVYPEIVAQQKDLKIVYTPIHGSGIMLVPSALETFGFTNVHIVEEQAKPDGNFPTVVYPNPEEKEAMSLGLKLAEKLNADILCGTDPDADRVAVGVKDHSGKWVLMNGNQTLVLAFAYLIEARKSKGIATPNDMVASTIVSTEMCRVLAERNSVHFHQVLTGFKWIAEKIKEKEGSEDFIVGGEESFGLMIGDQVRDKDSVSAVALLCEMAAYEKDKGRSLYDKIIDLYVDYGIWYEDLISITKKGMNGQQEIADMMDSYRKQPPVTINGSKVVKMMDYQTSESKDLTTGATTKILLPKSNVLQFVTEDGSKISARPSGTEPKIKFYFSVNDQLENRGQFDQKWSELAKRVEGIVQDMKLK